MQISKISHLVVVATFIVGLSCFFSNVGYAQGGLQGVWKFLEVSFTSSDTSIAVKNPQPSLYIFGKEYYSIMYVSGDKPRPLMADDATRDTITDEEMRSIFKPFVANSGKYELEGTKLTTRPIVALWPNFMAGGSNTYEFRVEADTLWLTAKYESGAILKLKLGRLE